MANDLEHSHWKSGFDDGSCRCPKSRKTHHGGHEQQAVKRNETELDECEGDGIAELHENGFSGVGGEG